MSDKSALSLVSANEASLGSKAGPDGVGPTEVVQPAGLRHLGRVPAPELARAGTGENQIWSKEG